MSFETACAALKDKLETMGLTGLGPSDISVDGDYTILNGSHRYACVLDYNGFTARRMAEGGSYLTGWKVTITLAVPCENSLQDKKDMGVLRAAILTHLRKWPRLGLADDIFDTQVLGGTDIPELVELGGMMYQLEELDVLIEEEEDVEEED